MTVATESQIPTIGSEVHLDDGRVARVTRQLGGGGQGVVYEVTYDHDFSLALKCYARAEPDQEQALNELIDRGSPSERFVWPITLARSSKKKWLGYVMGLLPTDFVGLAEFMVGKDRLGEPVGLEYVSGINLCYQLSRSFLKLHALGLCYRDINPGNVFLHRHRGDVLIVDNDNVGIDGTPSSVLGVGEFMAPEVVRYLDSQADAKALPSARTDRHSLAVTLFLVLCGVHPLVGTKTLGPIDLAWQIEHFGHDPVFIFDPDKRNNRPVVGETPLGWFLYPQFVRDLFIKAFTRGLHDPDERVLEGQWAEGMLRLRDCIRVCPSCNQTVFDDGTTTGLLCAGCKSALARPLRLDLGRRRPVIERGTRLWADQIQGELEATVAIGEVVCHPADPSRLGIRNQSKSGWTATDLSANVHPVQPGKAIDATPGMRIDFGPTRGVIGW